MAGSVELLGFNREVSGQRSIEWAFFKAFKKRCVSSTPFNLPFFIVFSFPPYYPITTVWALPQSVMNNDSQGSQAKILDLFILSCFCRDGALLGFVCLHYHGLRGKGLIRTLYTSRASAHAKGPVWSPPSVPQEPSRILQGIFIYIYISIRPKKM